MTVKHAHIRKSVFPITSISVVVCLAVMGGTTTAMAATTHLTPAAPDVVVQKAPIASAFDPATHQIFVANSGSDSISVIDSDTHLLLGRIGLGTGLHGLGVGPQALVMDETDELLYVGNYIDGSFSIIDTPTDTTGGSPVSLSTGANPDALAWDPVSNIVFIADYFNNQ